MIRLLAAIGLTACLTAPGAVAQSNKQWNDLLKPYEAKTKPPDAPATASLPQPDGFTRQTTATEIVEIETPGQTILCSSRNDADMVYLAGKFAWTQAMRMNEGMWKGLSERSAARKQAMRRLFSCEWGTYNLHYYHVAKKQATTTEVSYCLRPIASSSSSCWWLTDPSDPPFKDVKRPVELDGNVGESP